MPNPIVNLARILGREKSPGVIVIGIPREGIDPTFAQEDSDQNVQFVSDFSEVHEILCGPDISSLVTDLTPRIRLISSAPRYLQFAWKDTPDENTAIKVAFEIKHLGQPIILAKHPRPDLKCDLCSLLGRLE